MYYVGMRNTLRTLKHPKPACLGPLQRFRTLKLYMFYIRGLNSGHLAPNRCAQWGQAESSAVAAPLRFAAFLRLAPKGEFRSGGQSPFPPVKHGCWVRPCVEGKALLASSVLERSGELHNPLWGSIDALNQSFKRGTKARAVRACERRRASGPLIYY